MRDNSPKLAFLMKEAGLISNAFLEKLVAPGKDDDKSHKGLLEIMNQSAFSAETYRELFVQIKPLLVVSEDEEKTAIPDLRSTLQTSERELIYILEAFEPNVAALGNLLRETGLVLSPPQITTLSEAEAMGKRGYALLVKRGILTPQRLGEIIHKIPRSISSLNRVQQASDILVHNGLCAPEDFLEAFNQADAEKKPVGEILERSGKLTSQKLLTQLKEGLDLPEADLAGAKLPRKTLKLFPGSFVRRHIFLPLKRSKTTLTIAVADPLYFMMSDALSIMSGLVVIPLYASHDALVDQINLLYPDKGEEEEAAAEALEPGEDFLMPASIAQKEGSAAASPEMSAAADFGRMDKRADRQSAVQLVSSMVERAIAARATDIHIEPMEASVRVRYRIDGALRHVMNLPAEMREAVTARIKVLANMNVTERRRPQDGSFGLTINNGRFDFRVSALPTHIGEKIVIRILDQRMVLKAMGELGMNEFQERTLRSWIMKPYGIILVTGPTGSGKSSTLYSCLHTLNEEERNIITIEDPVEYQLSGINQVQVEPNIDLTFASGLRSSLRQDPDVIMVGEVRDLETARSAMRAALTGHLVLSTLHTNNAVGAISALKHMGIAPFVISSAVIGIVAQRLIRVLCKSCKQKKKASDAMLRDFGIKPGEGEQTRWFWQAIGCEHCFNTGYAGRTALFEMFVVDAKVRDLMANEATESDLVKASKEAGLTTLMDSAIEKIFDGTTTPEEIVKTVMLT
ncbi:MAG: ATPase, T2SS/T4P/T4SS family [Candidatus Sumerlaeota bacterium]|nr:ATPase, T2SS/T4P/T4SS family [Candidatus Sumerlaeota bacterium]